MPSPVSLTVSRTQGNLELASRPDKLSNMDDSSGSEMHLRLTLTVPPRGVNLIAFINKFQTT